jgi:hypothetical protein
MSIGNTKEYGNKGNNFPFQLKSLQGLQCACDQLQAINGNTDQVEGLLTLISNLLQNGQDYESTIVEDANGNLWLEVRIWNGTSFDPPVYYAAGTSTPGTPVAPLTYINSATYLAQIVSNTTGIATEATLIDVEANTHATTNLLSPISRTPGILRVSGANSTIAIETYSISFSNTGTANATVNTVIIKPGETINFDAGALNNTFPSGSFAYSTTTSGAELLIIYTTI